MNKELNKYGVYGSCFAFVLFFLLPQILSPFIGAAILLVFGIGGYIYSFYELGCYLGKLYDKN